MASVHCRHCAVLSCLTNRSRQGFGVILIIDYGMGNLGSIANMLLRIGVVAQISSDPLLVSKATKLILPGVGAFDEGMKNLHQLGLVEPLQRAVIEQGKPVLGICLGMQLFSQGSEEGTRAGLGWLSADTVRFKSTGNLKVPHMGWNTLRLQKDSPLLEGNSALCKYYFVHSYHLICHEAEDILAVTDHGGNFVAAVQRKRIYGTQFHPEKSHKYGIRLLANFVEKA
jgi:imidazole glycerol-phosphate synthase subunit HisH